VERSDRFTTIPSRATLVVKNLPLGECAEQRFQLGLACPPTPTLHPPAPLFRLNTFLSVPHFLFLIPFIKSHSPSLSPDCIFDIFIPYPTRWNRVVRSLSTTQSKHSLREALLLELELSIFLLWTVSRTSISIYNLFAASIAEHERNVAVLLHTVPIAITPR
jgi:hypothetical protein